MSMNSMKLTGNGIATAAFAAALALALPAQADDTDDDGDDISATLAEFVAACTNVRIDSFLENY